MAVRATPVIALGLAALAAVGAGTYFAAQRDRAQQLDTQYRAALRAAEQRLIAARQNQANLTQSEADYSRIAARGLMQTEDRVVLVEWLQSLRPRYRLNTLTYDIDPQRAARVGNANELPSINPRASRITIVASALHEGDALDFLSHLSEERNAFFSIDQCALKRTATAERSGLAPRVETECTVYWLTVRPKRSGV